MTADLATAFDPTADPKWMLLDVRRDGDCDWRGCDNCGRPHLRTFFVEESATGRRMHVGKTCWKRLNEQSPTHVHDMTEVGLSDCPSGCKVHRCQCGEETVEHSTAYGCRERG